MKSTTPRFRTQYNTKPEKGESNNGTTMTEPDATLSIKELLLNHTTARPYREPIYLEEMEMPDLGRMDLVEIQEMYESNNQSIADLKSQQLEIAQERKKRLAEKSKQNSQQGTAPDVQN